MSKNNELNALDYQNKLRQLSSSGNSEGGGKCESDKEEIVNKSYSSTDSIIQIHFIKDGNSISYRCGGGPLGILVEADQLKKVGLGGNQKGDPTVEIKEYLVQAITCLAEFTRNYGPTIMEDAKHDGYAYFCQGLCTEYNPQGEFCLKIELSGQFYNVLQIDLNQYEYCITIQKNTELVVLVPNPPGRDAL